MSYKDFSEFFGISLKDVVIIFVMIGAVAFFSIGIGIVYFLGKWGGASIFFGIGFLYLYAIRWVDKIPKMR